MQPIRADIQGAIGQSRMAMTARAMTVTTLIVVNIVHLAPVGRQAVVLVGVGDRDAAPAIHEVLALRTMTVYNIHVDLRFLSASVRLPPGCCA